MRSALLPFHLPSIGEEEIAEVVDTLRSGWLTTGRKAARFEADFAEYVGARHALAVSSGTAALHLALEAIGLRAGERVIVPTLTFAATAEVVCYLGAVPRLVDVDAETLTIDVGAVERLIEREAGGGGPFRAIIPVHYGGIPCDMDPLLELARRHGLAVIEDAAHALPTRYKGRMVGTIGDITAFSFYATKSVTTGEGGMVTTENPEWAARMRSTRLHGLTRDAWSREGTGGDWYYEITRLGYKYNLPDLAASVGLHQLRKCDAFQARREVIARRYTEAFAPMVGVDIPPVTRTLADGSPDGTRSAWHLYPALIDSAALSIDRNRFIKELKARNIAVSVHFIPLHLHPYYRDTLGCRLGDFPSAEHFYERCLSLPIYPGLTDADVEDVIAAVAEVADEFRR